MGDTDLTQSPEVADPPPGSDAVADEPTGAKKGFMSTTLGKIVVVGGSIALLGAVIAVTAFLVITFVLVDAADEVVDDLQDQLQDSAVSTTETGTVDATEDDTDVPAALGEEFSHEAVGVGDLHVWRDIFQPLLTPILEEASGTVIPDTTPDDNGGATYQADTLYLLDIFTGSSETAAQFYFNGIDYNTTTEFSSEDYIVVMEGERLSDTSWRLLQIGSTSVQLQFGDSTISLSMGQGVRK